tara:strand:+ start:19279 stop:19614 length:336 start_codon:yes stop_codon:yes gene_type:complete
MEESKYSIIEENKMIAHFMGLEIITDGINHFDTKFNRLKDYHKDWNALMPVIYKIIWLEGYDDPESYDEIYGGLTNALIGQTYNAVILFLENNIYNKIDLKKSKFKYYEKQ